MKNVKCLFVPFFFSFFGSPKKLTEEILAGSSFTLAVLFIET